MAGALFVYGTLMDEQRLSRLTGRRFARAPATLEGFRRVEMPGRYPYVVPCPGACVEGLLLEDVDAASLAALDRYEDEGRLYLRRAVEVTASGRRVACETYVGNEALLAR